MEKLLYVLLCIPLAFGLGLLGKAMIDYKRSVIKTSIGEEVGEILKLLECPSKIQSLINFATITVGSIILFPAGLLFSTKILDKLDW